MLVSKAQHRFNNAPDCPDDFCSLFIYLMDFYNCALSTNFEASADTALTHNKFPANNFNGIKEKN